VPKHHAHHVSTRVRKAALTRRERVAHTPGPNARAACWPSSRPRRGTRGGRAHAGRHGQGRTCHAAPWRPLRREGPNVAGRGATPRARHAEAAPPRSRRGQGARAAEPGPGCVQRRARSGRGGGMPGPGVGAVAAQGSSQGRVDVSASGPTSWGGRTRRERRAGWGWGGWTPGRRADSRLEGGE
jgi:hypothetical protein